MKNMIIKFVKKFCFLLNDTHGEFVFNINGCEITATFSKEYNYDLLPRLKEILIDNPHIRHKYTSNDKIEKRTKEAV